jgi:hypothetical protein
MRNLCIALILLLFTATSSSAQVRIVNASLNAERLTRSSCVTIQLLNNGAAGTVSLSGTVRSIEHGTLLRFSTGPFPVGSGTSSFTASELPIQQFEFSRTPMGRSVSVEGRLLAGNYEWCVILNDMENGEELDSYCDQVEVEDQLIMDLISPFDGDTIDEVRPTLVWTLTGPRVPEGQRVELTLVPLDKHQDTYRSMTTSMPHFVESDVRRTVVPFPMGVRDLERGRCYVWQVQRFLGVNSIDRSEAWRFCVSSPPALRADKYVLLGDGRNDGVYDVTDGMVFFRWDVTYTDVAPQCKVFDTAGTLVFDQATKENPQATPTAPGLYALDLRGLALRPGNYGMMVEDVKGTRDELMMVVTE